MTSLTPLSWFYQVGLFLKRCWQRRTPSRRLPVPVISVGNITVGGTGKTEAVVMLAWMLVSLGFKPGVLSRGYRRQSRARALVISDSQGLKVSVTEAGDEPYFLAKRLAPMPVVVGKDRLLTGKIAVQDLGCDVLILDDGFQRRYEVHRDLDLVLLDAADPFGGEKLLPAGRLREPLTLLAEAQALIITRANQYHHQLTLEKLAQLAPRVPVYTAQHLPSALVALAGKAERPLAYLQGRNILAACGIARPDAFLLTLQSLGAKVKACRFFPDHHWYSAEECQKILTQAKELQVDIIMTAKDAVKVSEYFSPEDLGWFLEVKFKLREPVDGLLAQIEQSLKGGQA